MPKKKVSKMLYIPLLPTVLHMLMNIFPKTKKTNAAIIQDIITLII